MSKKNTQEVSSFVSRVETKRIIETATAVVPGMMSLGYNASTQEAEEINEVIFGDVELESKESEEKIKKVGSSIGRSAISRLFYALTIVKQRLLQLNLKGSVEADVNLAMFHYSMMVEFNSDINSVEMETNQIQEMENTLAENDEINDKETIKNVKQAKFSFIKRAISKVMVSFRDHMIMMADKVGTKNIPIGNFAFGFIIPLGPVGSISIKCRVLLQALVHFSNLQKNLIKQRQFGSLVIRLDSGKALKKDNSSVSFRIGEEKKESSLKYSFNPNWNETFDAFPCASAGDEICIKLLHKNKNIGKKLIEEIFINVDKMKFENNIPKLVDIPLLSGGSLQVEFTFKKIDPNLFDGFLKIEAIEGNKLAKKDFSGKSDPYLVFFPGRLIANRINPTSESLVKTKYIKQSLNPVWNETFTMKIPVVKEGFTIFCYDYDMTGDHDFMGKVFVPLDDVKAGNQYDKWLEFERPQVGKIRIKYQFIPKRRNN